MHTLLQAKLHRLAAQFIFQLSRSSNKQIKIFSRKQVERSQKKIKAFLIGETAYTAKQASFRWKAKFSTQRSTAHGIAIKIDIDAVWYIAELVRRCAFLGDCECMECGAS